MEKALIFALIFLVSGILVKVFKRTKSILLGYGVWRMKTLKHFQATNEIAGNAFIIFSLSYISLYLLVERLTDYSIFGIPTVVLLGLFLIILFITIHFKLNKIDSESSK